MKTDKQIKRQQADEEKERIKKEAKQAIAKKAKALGTNARGLKNIIDKVLLPYQFDAQ